LIVVGSAVCIVANSGTVFIIGRAIAGLGVAAISPAGLTMLTHMTTAEERPFYIAIIVSVEAISLALGAILGGVITEKANYRICFVPNFPLGAMSCFIGSYYFRLPPGKAVSKVTSWKIVVKSYDPLGCFLFVTSTLFLLVGLELVNQTNNWGAPKVVVFLIFSGLIGIGLVFQQRYADQSIVFIPTGILNREVVLALSMGFLIIAANQLTSYYLALYFEVRVLVTFTDCCVLTRITGRKGSIHYSNRIPSLTLPTT